MKRHHQRQAQQLLTLSLMGSLALLAACGGGGKGGAPAAAAPAAVVASEPTLLEVTDKNEPYLVSPSSTVSNTVSRNKYQLNIIDGVTRTVAKKISFASPLTTGKWLAVNLIQRTQEVGSSTFTEVDKGPSTLYYVMPEGESTQPVAPIDAAHPDEVSFWHNPGGKVFQFDLRRDSTLTEQAISSITNACTIKASYNVQQDGSQTALVVTTAGPDNECGNPNGNFKEKLLADDNVDRVVVTNDATSTAARVPAQPKAKVLQYLYQNGTLTGVLAERKLTSTTAQLDVLSPLLDTVLAAGIPLPGPSSVSTTYTISDLKPETGAQWVARAPGSYANGYFRLQDTTATKPFNYLYKFTWDASTTPTPTVLAELSPLPLKPGAATNPGVTDAQYVYYVNGSTLVFGPTDDPDVPFNTVKLTSITTTDPITAMYQTPKSVIVIQKSGDDTHVVAFSKATGATAELTTGQLGNNFQVLGLRGENIYTSQVTSDLKGARLNRFSTVVPYTDVSKQVELLQPTGLVVHTKVMDNTLFFGEKKLSSLVTCVPTDQLGDSCLGSTLKVFDIDTKALTKELGSLSISTSDTISVSANSAPLAANNNVFQVTRPLLLNGEVRVEPWVFHSKAAQSLAFIETLKTVTPAPAPASTPASN